MPDVTKFLHRVWISPSEEVIEMGTGQQHSYYAKQYYEKKGIEVTSAEAVERFFEEGWIRVQVKPDSAALEGTQDAIVHRGDLIFTIEPNFTKLIFSFTDTGRYKQVLREKVEGWSWNSIVKEAKKGTIE